MTNDDPFPVLSDTAMVLAAGFGARLKPLTLTKPKPLFEVGGQAMLDRALDHIKEAGLKKAVVNTHYLGEQIAAHMATRRDLNLIQSAEEKILDTGGGVKNALHYFGGKPFFVLGGDLPWTNGAVPVLDRMASFWDGDKMDVFLLLYPTEDAKGFAPREDGSSGDFMMVGDGRVWREQAPPQRPFVWLSVMIVKPELYDEIQEPVFSNNRIFDLAESRGRLYGLVHDGTCYHVGTPQDLKEANRLWDFGEGWG